MITRRAPAIAILFGAAASTDVQSIVQTQITPDAKKVIDSIVDVASEAVRGGADPRATARTVAYEALDELTDVEQSFDDKISIINTVIDQVAERTKLGSASGSSRVRNPEFNRDFVASKMKGVFEEGYNAGLFDQAAAVFREAGIELTFNDMNPLTEEPGAMTEGDVSRQGVVKFLDKLATDEQCVDMKLTILDVGDNEHEDVWACAGGWGQSQIKWQQGEIVSDVMTFTNINSTTLSRDIVMQKIHGVLELNYNEGRNADAASVYKETGRGVSVNGKNPLTDTPGVMETRDEVASYLNSLSSSEQIKCKDISYYVSRVAREEAGDYSEEEGAWYHEDVWSCSEGVGTSFARWIRHHDDWVIWSSAMTFAHRRGGDTLSLSVVKQRMLAVFQKEFNHGHFGRAASVYGAGVLQVTVKGGASMSGTATNRNEVAQFLQVLAEEGCTNMQWNSFDLKEVEDEVVANEHVDEWTCDLGSGTHEAVWEKDENGDWFITADKLTFNPGESENKNSKLE